MSHETCRHANTDQYHTLPSFITENGIYRSESFSWQRIAVAYKPNSKHYFTERRYQNRRNKPLGWFPRTQTKSANCLKNDQKKGDYERTQTRRHHKHDVNITTHKHNFSYYLIRNPGALLLIIPVRALYCKLYIKYSERSTFHGRPRRACT